MQRVEHRNDATVLCHQRLSPHRAKVHQRVDRLLNQDWISWVHECLYGLDNASQTDRNRNCQRKQARFVNRVLRPCSDADPPPFLGGPPPMLPLLEVCQPLDHRRDPARKPILQAHREQLVVHFKTHILFGVRARAVHARSGKLDAGERE